VAKDYDASAKACAHALGFELKEMQGWLCCGAVLSNVEDNLMTRAGPNRILARAQQEGDRLVTLCAGCYNVLKRTDLRARLASPTQQSISTFNEESYNGRVNVVHFLEVLRDQVGFDAIEKAVKVPLKGLPVGAYYGCLLLRPFEEMKFDDPNRPSILENLLMRLGCTPIDYPARTDCCGSYLSVGSSENSQPMSAAIVKSAQSCGARLLAVGCPLCKYNLESSQLHDAKNTSAEEYLPVVYFTQLLGLALGLRPDELDLDTQQMQAIREVQIPTSGRRGQT
jgi:heterodisulfide reductase subunit B